MTEAEKIDEYANSMFAMEQFNEAWINECAQYIKYLFGNQVIGKTIVDYAFGRGNWALAFLKAGARKVVAIDASRSNISRFNTYLQENRIQGIELIHGNILYDQLSCKGDIIWLYGIMPVISDEVTFLKRILTLSDNNQLLFYIYYYNAPSPRQFIVETCRRILRYETMAGFLDNAFLFVRQARMRARDDLVAPHVKFYTIKQLVDLLNSVGLYPIRKDIDFSEFQTGIAGEEFYPHQLLCVTAPDKEKPTYDIAGPFEDEIKILYILSNMVLGNPSLSDEGRKRLAIGLYNTHFANLKPGFQVRETLVEDFLFLASALLHNEYLSGLTMPRPEELERYMVLLADAVCDNPGRVKALETIGHNTISEYLCTHRVRL
jgi:hypothetical protein